MTRACVNPLNTDDHDGPGGDQFCIFCLRKRGDDALRMVASTLALLRAVEWAAQYGYDETAGACPSCGWPERVAPRRKACTFGHADRQQGCSSCTAMGAQPPPADRDRTHAPDCALEAAVKKAEALLNMKMILCVECCSRLRGNGRRWTRLPDVVMNPCGQCGTWSRGEAFPTFDVSQADLSRAVDCANGDVQIRVTCEYCPARVTIESRRAPRICLDCTDRRTEIRRLIFASETPESRHVRFRTEGARRRDRLRLIAGETATERGVK